MTHKDYMKLVGNKLGWERVPPGSRLSTYHIPEYAKAAEAYAKPVLTAMGEANQDKPTAQPISVGSAPRSPASPG
jgi:sorbitol/mannitol transport system substrate-binding protein